MSDTSPVAALGEAALTDVPAEAPEALETAHSASQGALSAVEEERQRLNHIVELLREEASARVDPDFGDSEDAEYVALLNDAAQAIEELYERAFFFWQRLELIATTAKGKLDPTFVKEGKQDG